MFGEIVTGSVGTRAKTSVRARIAAYPYAAPWPRSTLLRQMPARARCQGGDRLIDFISRQPRLGSGNPELVGEPLARCLVDRSRALILGATSVPPRVHR